MNNFYLRLDVSMSVSPDELKKAYWRLARELHPDTQSGDRTRFEELHEAYRILADPTLRKDYDAKRAEWVKRIGAILCIQCGSANVITRRPQPHERIVCAHCSAPLPLDLNAVISLQKARLVAEAARVVDNVGVELAEAAAGVIKVQINKLRKRWTEN